MPLKPPHPCNHPGCRALVQGTYCDAHQRDKWRNSKSRDNQQRMRMYWKGWRRAREAYLVNHPLCIHCQIGGRLEPARVVDHRVPHQGDPNLFWNQDNWQALCTPCHNHKTMTEDRNRTRGSGGSKLSEGTPATAAPTIFSRLQ